MNLRLEDDQHCFVCGDRNASGLRLSFDLRDGKAISEFTFLKIHQGYKDIVHGGLLSTVLDEAMVKASLMQGMPAVTAEITVRFRSPLYVDEKAIVEAEIIGKNRKVIGASAVIKKENGVIVAEGHAKLLIQ
ncbi:MAG: PaaI family thioesterase [Nitrospirota bacterium]